MNHYDILEVSPRASAEVIRAAYRSLMQRYHPDRHADAAQATERAAEISLAYDVLSDPERRRAYDETLRQRPPADELAGMRAHAGVPLPRGPQAQAAPGGGWRSWYAGLLILCIIGAGWAIFTLQKKPAAATPAAQLPAPSAAVTVTLGPADAPQQAALSAPSGDSAAVPQVRTLAAFVTDLSIELTPATRPAAAHVLQIPNLGLRVSAGDSARLAERVEAQRALIIQQLLSNLARADYHELIKTDGDLYLKRLIEDTVCSGLCPEPVAGLAAAIPPVRPVEALLPLSYSLR